MMSFLRVRMYRQGLGDCFLLSFPRAGGEAHVLIDCGVLLGTPDADAKVQRVAESILATTGGQLAALVVTHQHWDHVSGFLQAEAIFNQLKINEVWLAWTEDPQDDLAKELADRRSKALAGIQQAALHLDANSGAGGHPLSRRLQSLLEFHGGLAARGRRSTSQAMAWAKSRNGARVRYFRPGTDPVQIPGLDYLQVFVLGPPRDVALLRKSHPSRKHREVYELADVNEFDGGFLAAVHSLAGNHALSAPPFDEWFRISDYDAWEDDFFGEHYGFDDDEDHENAWRRVETDWLGVAGRLALQLDSHTNNTSLALAFELHPSGRVLLFPGDARVGNWLSWSHYEWSLKTRRTSRTVTIADLLARTVLYKVGHHGSHNATLREQGLELMTHPELTAMISVDRPTAKLLKWQMPFPSLYRRLEEKTQGRILTLDQGLPAPPSGTSQHDWQRFLDRTRVQPHYIDYHIDLD
jgi:beta-lactamase superfamily II metal-dependent hydrolase